jgi:hypothetical protein
MTCRLAVSISREKEANQGRKEENRKKTDNRCGGINRRKKEKEREKKY